MSPTVLRVRGYRFYFFSREEPRPHVHVHHADGEAKFWLTPDIELASDYGLGPARIRTALRLSRSMKMRSVPRGRGTSAVEVGNVSSHGFWLLVGDRERFLSFKIFPWFRDATIGQLTNVELPSPHHLRWPELDIDLALKSLDHPERYPLVSRVQPDVGIQSTGVRVREVPPASNTPRRRRRRV